MHELVSLLKEPAFLFFAFLFFAVFMGSLTKMARTNPDGGPFASRRKKALNAQDVREIQELHKGFEELSRRIEALETILLEKVKKH
jgi:hypothetical protein